MTYQESRLQRLNGNSQKMGKSKVFTAEIDERGFYKKATKIEGAFYNVRPPNTEVSLLVIHCISLPEGHYGGPHIQALFTGTLNCQAHPSFWDLEGVEVSAHCVICRTGEVEQYVSFLDRAWHAGISEFEGVAGCNDYSIGIELEGTDKTPYTKAQYSALLKITEALQKTYPAITKNRIKAHSDIAPERKTDPGSEFNWTDYLQKL